MGAHLAVFYNGRRVLHIMTFFKLLDFGVIATVVLITAAKFYECDPKMKETGIGSPSEIVLSATQANWSVHLSAMQHQHKGHVWFVAPHNAGGRVGVDVVTSIINHQSSSIIVNPYRLQRMGASIRSMISGPYSS